jgi:pimeloyl-ACP methyl ester carboxylesterase
MDRRGRGGSGTPAEHALEREFEDVAAVIDAAGGNVDLIGHSYGAHCALGAAAIAPHHVKHLVLYEPPTMAQMVADGFEQDEPSHAVAEFFTHNVGLPPEQVDALRASPLWPYFVAHAPSYPPEMRAFTTHKFDPKRFGGLHMPVMLLVGSETGERLGAILREIEPYLNTAEWHTLEGQGHDAMRTAPNELARAVIYILSR